MDVGEELNKAIRILADAGVDSPQLDAQIIMAWTLGCSRVDVIAHPERVLTDPESDTFHSMLTNRASRFPLPYITQEKEFYGLPLYVAPGVLVPRPETEVLVGECLKRLSPPHPHRVLTIADIGVGSGAIAVALAMKLPEARVYGTELSRSALEVARNNVLKYHLEDRVYLVEGDLLEPLTGSAIEFDAIVSNPPYIPSADIESLQPEVRLYEPKEALDGGQDGLDAYRRILPQALGVLREEGFVAVEIGAGQDEAVVGIAGDAGYRRVEVIPDLAGILRVVVAYR